MALWTARQIWSAMPKDRREAAALALWEDENLNRQARLTCLAPWLAARGIRPQFLEQMPKTRRARLLAEGGAPEDTAMQALLSFHLRERRPMLGRFLDALGIEHENGLIKDGAQFEPPDAEKVAAAVGTLRAEFPAEDVDVYLRTLTASDPETWANVATLAGEPR